MRADEPRPIRPTSPAQLQALKAGTIAAAEDIDADTFVVPLATGYDFITSTLCYVLRDGGGAAHIVDPGVESEENLRLLLDAIRARGIDRVATVTATHMHPDHLGLAARIREETGARLVFGRLESTSGIEGWRNAAGRARALDEWGVPEGRRDDMLEAPDADVPDSRQSADVLLDEGDELPIPGRNLTTLHTPGHTPGHLSFIEDRRNRVFTGDHVLPHLNPGIGLGGPFHENAMAVGLDALDRMSAFDGYEALPGHGYRFIGLSDRAATIARHHRARAAEIDGVMQDAPGASVWEVASRIRWTAGWETLSGFHRLSALAQTALHVDRLRARRG